MTRAQIRADVAARARMNEDDSEELALLNGWINRAQEDVQNFNTWWFLEHEFSITPVASTRLYAFPTTDIASNSGLVLATIDRNSMHTAAGRLRYFFPSQQDREEPGWLDTSLAGSTGSPQWWSTIRRQIVFDVAPTAAWVTDNNPVYFRGYVNLADLSADGSTSTIPAEWHWVLVEGALWRALHYQDPMGTAWERQKSFFGARGRRFGTQSVLEQMVERCRPVQMRPRRIPVPAIFSLSGRRSVNVRN